MRYDPEVINFNGGEVTPLMYARTDYNKFRSSAQLCENFIPSILGPLRRRPGTQYVGNPKYYDFNADGKRTVLVPFSASTSNEFILEIGGDVGSGYIRFWDAATRLPIKDNGATWSPFNAGAIAELATPWTANDLYTKDEHNNINGLGLQWIQSNDVMWLVCRGQRTVKLSRIAQYKFSWQYMGDGFNVPTPFKDVNPLNTITVQASAALGAGITLTANAALFTAADVGTYFYLEQAATDLIPAWEPAKATVANARVRSNGRNYVTGGAATTGTVPPSHSSGTKVDGTVGVAWRWTDDGYGIVAITGFTDATHVTATVVLELPGTVVTTPTTRWARAAWSAAEGWPSSVAFFRQRLCFARDNTIWTSVSADFENFTRKFAGQVTLDASFVGTLAGDKNDRILWLYGTTALLAGTASGEWAIGEQASAQAFGPGNAKAEKQTGYGSIPMPPLKIDNSLLYLQRGGARLREMSFNALAGTSGVWQSDDRSQLAEHLTPRYGFLTVVHQRQPESVLWISSASGRLFSMTYDKAQNVYAWARHRLGGFGAFDYNVPPGGIVPGPLVTAMCSVKSPDGVSDDVWMMVSRFDSGNLNVTIEVIGPADSLVTPDLLLFHDIDAVESANYLDCSTVAFIPSGATILATNPLAIPEDAIASALIDGNVAQDARTTSVGMPIDPTADNRAGRVGFSYQSNYWTLPLQGQTNTGSPQGKISRVHGITLRIWNSVGFKYGTAPPTGSATEIFDRCEMRIQDMPMNTAVPLQSGDYYVQPSGGYVDQPTIYIQQDQPLPLTILAAYPKLTVEGAR